MCHAIMKAAAEPFTEHVECRTCSVEHEHNNEHVVETEMYIYTHKRPTRVIYTRV